MKTEDEAKGHDVATQEGLFMNMIKVDYNPEFATNILGGAEMRHIYGFDWSYDRSSDIFYLNVGEKRMVFNMENYLYAYDPTDDYEMTNVFATMKTKDQKEQIPEVLGINNYNFESLGIIRITLHYCEYQKRKFN